MSADASVWSEVLRRKEKGSSSQDEGVLGWLVRRSGRCTLGLLGLHDAFVVDIANVVLAREM